MKNAKKRAPSISIRWQLMFFIGAMTLLTVGLIWGIITYALAPKYNATIRQNLTNKASAITAIFDQTDSEISSRDFGVLQLDDDFWTALGQTFSDKKINMDGYCVDFSDSTLRCLKAYESMFPCLLHESSGSFSGEFGYNLNTRQLITFRQELFEEGSLYKIVQIGSTDRHSRRGAAQHPVAGGADLAGAGSAVCHAVQPVVHPAGAAAFQRCKRDCCRQL